MDVGESYHDFFDDFVFRYDDMRNRTAPAQPLRARNVVEKKTRRGVLLYDDFRSLRRELNQWEQETMYRDLEMVHVPEKNGENLVNIVMAIGGKLGVPITERNIVYAIRSGVRSSRAPQTSGRARRITVRLVSRKLRDAVLDAAGKGRHVTTVDVGLPGIPHRIELNERLTHANRRLLRLTRIEVRTKGWQYLWVKHGTIFVRKNERSNVCMINSYESIMQTFAIA